MKPFVCAYLFITAACFLSCKKQVPSLVAPGDELVSKVEVFKAGRKMLSVDYTFDNFDRLVKLDILDYPNNFSEEVRCTYTTGMVKLSITTKLSAQISATYSLIFKADANSWLQSYQMIAEDGVIKDYTFVRDSTGRIISIWGQEEVVSISYDDFGINSTYMQVNEDSAIPVFRSESFEPNWAESFEPGINNIAMIPELRRDAYPIQPYYLDFLSFQFNPDPMVLPQQSAITGDNQASMIEYYYQYARDLQGRITEMRKFTRDFRTDYRVRFTYVPKKLP
jgi:hypothetical protein